MEFEVEQNFMSLKPFLGLGCLDSLSSSMSACALARSCNRPFWNWAFNPPSKDTTVSALASRACRGISAKWVVSPWAPWMPNRAPPHVGNLFCFLSQIHVRA